MTANITRILIKPISPKGSHFACQSFVFIYFCSSSEAKEDDFLEMKYFLVS